MLRSGSAQSLSSTGMNHDRSAARSRSSSIASVSSSFMNVLSRRRYSAEKQATKKAPPLIASRMASLQRLPGRRQSRSSQTSTPDALRAPANRSTSAPFSRT
jgi:hypothetical protein